MFNRRAVFWYDSRCIKVAMIHCLAHQNPIMEAEAWYNSQPEAMQFPYTDIEVDEYDYGNIDVSKTPKEISGSVIGAIGWLNRNGFTGYLSKYTTNKAEFVVTRNGVTDILTLTAAVQNSKKVNINDYMEQFGKSFEMKCEIERLKAKKRAMKGV